MPIEIRELIIKTTVESSDASETGNGGQSGGDEKQELIQECVDQVMEILKEKSER